MIFMFFFLTFCYFYGRFLKCMWLRYNWNYTKRILLDEFFSWGFYFIVLNFFFMWASYDVVSWAMTRYEAKIMGHYVEDING